MKKSEWQYLPLTMHKISHGLNHTPNPKPKTITKGEKSLWYLRSQRLLRQDTKNSSNKITKFIQTFSKWKYSVLQNKTANPNSEKIFGIQSIRTLKLINKTPPRKKNRKKWTTHFNRYFTDKKIQILNMYMKKFSILVIRKM